MTDRTPADNRVSHSTTPTDDTAAPARPSRAPQTIAEQVAVNFFSAWGVTPNADTWQGESFGGGEGPHIYAAAHAAACRVERAGHAARRYTYLDGSAIVTSPSGWEIGFAAQEVEHAPALAYRPANGRTVGALFFPERAGGAVDAARAASLPVAGMVPVRVVQRLYDDYERARAKVFAVSAWLDARGVDPGDDIIARLNDYADRSAAELRDAVTDLAEAHGWLDGYEAAPSAWDGPDAGAYIGEGGERLTWGACRPVGAAMCSAVVGANGGAL